MKRRLMVLALCIILVLLTTACFAVDPDLAYMGNHLDLAATAVYSIPGINSSTEDKFLILDEDQYGRVLFAAYLPDGALISNSFYDGILAIIVMQNCSNSSVQFYGEKNYIARIVQAEVDLNQNLIYQYFAEEELSALQEANDWNCVPAEKDGIIQVPLSAENNERLSAKTRKQIAKSIGTNIRYVFFREGVNGSKVFFILDIPENKTAYIWYLAAFDDKGDLIEDSVMSISQDIEKLPSSVESFLNALSIHDA